MKNQMTITDEAVQAAVIAMNTNDMVAYDSFNARQSADARRILTAALPFLTGVKVKELKWSEVSEPNEDIRYTHITANSSVGRWSIEWKSWKDYDDKTIFLNGDFIGNGGDNLEAAKAAAQADYSARILSAIEVAPSPRAQALEEALQKEKSLSDRLASALEYIDDYCLSYPDLGTISAVAQPALKAHSDARALSSQPVADGSAAERDMLSERRRQVEAEGWTLEHDDQWRSGEMAGAAACYALNGATYKAPSHYPPRKVYAAVAEARRDAEKDMSTTIEAIRMAIGDPKAPQRWPWDASWWKPSDRRRNLVKAGALILAEIERLDRLPASPGASE